VAVTTYNEVERSAGRWLRENLEAMLRSPHVGDIVVVNDGTPDYGELSGLLYQWFGTRVRCQQNPENLGVFGNKLTSLEAARGEWCVIADSDNVFNVDYFDRIMALRDAVPCGSWDPCVAYVASFGRTDFDYRPFIGDWTLANAPEIVGRPCGWCLCNCGNWFVNRKLFLAAFDGIPRKRFDLAQPDYLGIGDRTDLYWRRVYDALDSFYINKRWWLAGGTLRVVDGLEYTHRVDTVAPGNYVRSPQEKECIGPIYLVEMIDAADGKSYGYHVERRAGRDVFLRRDDGAMLRVNSHTGGIEVVESPKPADGLANAASNTEEESVEDKYVGRRRRRRDGRQAELLAEATAATKSTGAETTGRETECPDDKW
jgi:glycosyltransferase involved in cell wall biosynthesis